MTPGGTGTKRKRTERTYSQDGLGADQPPAKSPRGSRFPSGAQTNSYSQGRNRDGTGRGGRDGARGGSRQANSPTNTAFKAVPASNPVPIPQAPPAAVQPSPLPTAVKQQPIENGDSLQTKPEIPSYRHYATMTEEVVDSWQDQGKTMILEQASSARQSQDHIRLGCLFQEIIFSGLDGRMALTETGKTIKQIITDNSSEGAQDAFDQDTAEAFLDTVAISCSNDTKNLRLRQILLATEIPSETIVMILGDDMLEAQKLVRPNWTRMTIKHQTNALYRQANYNLLREETEGYSKLVTELFTTVENESCTDEVARVSFEKVKAMIGAFNLDVGRVLDVTLDVFAAILVRHSTFLVKFLQLSTWWPRESSSVAHGPATADQYGRDQLFWTRVKEVGLKAFFELGTKRADAADLDAVLPNALRKWVEETGTLPPKGNEDAAQILGFKLRFYNSAARDPDDNLPSNLIYLSALLIKIGFISLPDLYPHLWPSDEDMKAVESKLVAEKEEREKERKPGGRNALELAGALVDDTLPPPPRKLPEPIAKSTTKPNTTPDSPLNQEKPATEAKQLPDPVEQKIQLLRSLLCIGAIPEALFMLGQFPWLVDLIPELPEHINRIVHQSLSLVYDQIRPLQDHEEICTTGRYADPEQVAAQKGLVQLARVTPRKTLRWAQIDRADGADGVDYKFYWEEWTNNVPLCHNVDDVFLLCNTFLNLSSFKIGLDPLLMAKLSRIGLHSLETDTSEENKTRWMALCKRLLVPALSLCNRNSGTVAEVWRLLKRFPATTRYNIYFEWYLGQTSRNKDIVIAFNYAQSETKNVLKKISKTNTRPMARLLAKVAVASPGKVFEVIIKQIESYDNLIGVVVEASRFFTELGYDVLVWSLINALGKARNRVQKDGLLTSQWLSKLAGFCGTVFKKYPVMNPIPVLQYVTNQLLNHNSTDLVVLEHLIKQMAGITQDASFDNSKIIAMCGGPVLRAKTMASLDDERSDPTKQNSTKRLMKALVTSNLTGALLVAISQERQSCIFNIDEADAYLKLLGNFFDEIHRVLTQYVDLVHTNLDDKEFKTLVPKVTELIGKYGIEPAVAFWIWRPTIAADIAVYDRNVLEKNATAALVDSLKDTEMTDGDNPSEDKVTEATEPAKIEDADVAMIGDSIEVVEPSEARPGHPVIQELIESVRSVLPATTFEMISDLFYFTFWRLSPYDLHIPETYQEESKRLGAKIEQLKKERGGTSLDVRNREIQRKQLTEQNTKIAAELKDHLTAYQRTKVALVKEKDQWFDLSAGKYQDLNLAILEHCFIPRMVLSSVDSYFVFKMLKVLHSMGAKNFRTMGLLDCFFDGKRLLPLIFSCTQKEAENVARFISETLKDLKKWHANKDMYEKEAFGAKRDLPGFKKNLRDADSFMDYESFRTLLAKWHRNLYDAIRECLKSPEYMHIKNAILISKEVVDSFPAIDWIGRNIEEAVKHVNTNDERGDLKMLSLALLGMLKSRSGKWVTAPVFARHKQGQINGPPSIKANSISAKSPAPTKSPADTPQSNNVLNAKAPEFVPTPISVDPTKKREIRGEAEDGEIRTPVTAKPVTSSANPTHNVQQSSESNNSPFGVDGASSTQQTAAKAINGKPGDKASDKTSDRSNDRTNAQLPARPLTDARRSDGSSRPDLIPRTQSHPSRQPEPPRNHVLPSRSDFSDPQRSSNLRASDWAADRGLPRANNDQRDTDYRRSDRPGDVSRAIEADYRGPSRPYDRPHHGDRDLQGANWNGERANMSRSHDDRGPPPHLRNPMKDEKVDRLHRDAPLPDSRDRYREPEAHETRSRDNSRAPKSVGPPHSDRTALLKTAQEHERGQHGGHADRRHEPERAEFHGPSSARPSRGSSPVRRGEDNALRSDYKRYDDRPGLDTRRSTEQAPPRSRHDDQRQPHPSRSDHHGDNMQAPYGDRSRDDARNAHPVRQDQNSNWHKQEPRLPPRQQDSSYGRLNQDPPAGPRTTNNPNATTVAPRQTRSNSLQQAPTDSRNSASLVPSSSGPVGGREQKRAASNYVRPPPITTTVTPSTSIPPSPDTAGIHPDRLKALQGPDIPEIPSNNGAMRPPPAQVPAGPRNSVPEASGSPSTLDSNRSRSDKRFAQLNNVLSQANGSPGAERPSPGPTTRGRGEQANDAVAPAYPSSKELTTPTSTGPRQDQFANRGTPTNTSRNDEAPPRRALRSDDRPLSRSQDGYGHGDNTRSKAGYSNPRENNMRPPSGDMRDNRSRNSAPFPQTPPLHNHQDRDRRPPRESMPGPNDRSNGRRDGGREEWGGEQQQQRSGQPRRDHQQHESGGGSGRKRGRGNEEMYDHGPAAYDQSKRPRRG